MEAPAEPQAVYQNSGFPTGCIAAAAMAVSLVTCGLAVAAMIRGEREEAVGLIFPIAIATTMAVLYYFRHPIELWLAPSFIAVRYPFGKPKWIPVSALHGRIHKGRLGPVCEFRVSGAPALSLWWRALQFHMAFFSERSSGGELTGEIVLACIPHLEVDNSWTGRLR